MEVVEEVGVGRIKGSAAGTRRRKGVTQETKRIAKPMTSAD